MKNWIRIVLHCVLLSVMLPSLAAAEGLQLQNESFQEVVVKGKNGKPEKKRVKVTNAVPGTEVIFVLTYRNTGNKPATRIVINDDVPTSLAYVPASAEGTGTVAEVSVDGGKTFGALERLKVKAADGSLRAARADEVTHVRWTLQAALPAGKEGSVSYRAIVK